MNKQIYLVLVQSPSATMIQSYYTSDKLVVVNALEEAKNKLQTVYVYYFPQMKEIRNVRVTFNWDQARKNKGEEI